MYIYISENVQSPLLAPLPHLAPALPAPLLPLPPPPPFLLHEFHVHLQVIHTTALMGDNGGMHGGLGGRGTLSQSQLSSKEPCLP